MIGTFVGCNHISLTMEIANFVCCNQIDISSTIYNSQVLEAT